MRFRATEPIHVVGHRSRDRAELTVSFRAPADSPSRPEAAAHDRQLHGELGSSP
jgi:hypothetical protein